MGIQQGGNVGLYVRFAELYVEALCWAYNRLDEVFLFPVLDGLKVGHAAIC